MVDFSFTDEACVSSEFAGLMSHHIEVSSLISEWCVTVAAFLTTYTVRFSDYHVVIPL